jgi:CHAT domain-containing protein
MIPPDYKAREDSINFQISLLNQRISGLKEDDPARYNLNTQVDRLAAKMADLENLYREKYPSYYNLKFSSEVINPEFFQNSLKADECVVEFLLHRNFLISFYLDRKSMVITTDTLRKVNLSQLAERFYNRTNNFSPSQYKPDSVKKFANEAQQLYTILLKPFEDKFSGKKITIVADNNLRKIPFEVLLTKVPDDFSGYKNLPYLIKKNSVYYAPSITFLNELRQRPHIKSRARLLAIAPIYSSLKLNDTISRMLLAVRADTSVFGSLPNAQNEIKFAHAIAGGRYLTQKRATETRFKKMASNYDILHLATHGLLNSESSLQSKLLFADSHPHDDGFLHNYEIYNLKQESQLVILSACNTGAGKNYAGEDVISTGRGFLSSGSRSVIMTLWPVNDQASFNLIKGFYQGLKDKLPVCDALRQSKLNFLEQSDKLHSHPYFWTGYIIYGDASIVLPVRNNERVYWMIAAGLLLIGAVFVWLKIRNRRSGVLSH